MSLFKERNMNTTIIQNLKKRIQELESQINNSGDNTQKQESERLQRDLTKEQTVNKSLVNEKNQLLSNVSSLTKALETEKAQNTRQLKENSSLLVQMDELKERSRRYDPMLQETRIK